MTINPKYKVEVVYEASPELRTDCARCGTKDVVLLPAKPPSYRVSLGKNTVSYVTEDPEGAIAKYEERVKHQRTMTKRVQKALKEHPRYQEYKADRQSWRRAMEMMRDLIQERDDYHRNWERVNKKIHGWED